jgi:hypothetical protein
MEDLIKKIQIRIETNEECVENFSLSSVHKESILSENNFLIEIVDELKNFS